MRFPDYCTLLYSFRLLEGMLGLEMTPKGEEIAAAEPVLAIDELLGTSDLAQGAPVARTPLLFHGAVVKGNDEVLLFQGAPMATVGFPSTFQGAPVAWLALFNSPLRISPSHTKPTRPKGKC
jgi:hypothetical protein